jgi:hypothetical protein
MAREGSKYMPRYGAAAYRVRDAVGESHKLNCVFGVLPVWSQGEDEVERRGVRVCVVVAQRYVP